MLVDSHCHLDFDSFERDRSEVIQRARSAGVQALVTICTRVSRFAEILEIAESNSEIWCSVGIHPHHTEEEEFVSVDDLVSRASHPKVIELARPVLTIITTIRHVYYSRQVSGHILPLPGKADYL